MHDFMSKYWDRIFPDPMSGCYLWAGGSSSGYGHITRCKKQYLAHRCAFESVHGERSADGLVVRHKCDNKLCVNPDHLEIGTHKDNTADAWRRGRVGGQFKARELHPSSKLTSDDVADIRTALSRGEKNSVLSRKYNVSCATISGIKVGRTWT
jgi:hypothetical protein